MTIDNEDKLVVKRRYPELDGLRAVAILLVLWWHSSQLAYNSAPSEGGFANIYFSFSIWGACGVSLFFVLSGFLITGILMDISKEKHCLKHFYIRRALRIFPVYYLGLILISILSYLYFPAFKLEERLFAHLFYIQNMDGYFMGVLPFRYAGWGFFEHFWSLAVEVQFYMIWPVFFLWIYKNLRFSEGLTMMLLLIIFSSYTRYSMTLDGYWQYAHVTTIARIDALVMGAMLAYIMKTRQDVWQRLKKVAKGSLILCSTVLLIVPLYMVHFDLLLMYARYLIFIGSIYSFILVVFFMNRWPDQDIYQRILCSRFMKLMARVSYGFYIFHLPILIILQYHLEKYTSLNYWSYHIVLFLMGGIITLLISWLSYSFFESRILKLKDKYAPL